MPGSVLLDVAAELADRHDGAAVVGAGVYKLKDVPGGDNPYGYRGLGEVYVFIFFEKRLYAESGLQLFFIAANLWGWALVAQVAFMLIGYPWYTGNILFAFAVTGQVLRWVSQPSWYYTLPAAGLLVTWIPLSTGSYGMAGVGMLTASWLLCRAQHAQERLGYGVLWALMVLLMNMHDVSESVAGLAIALLTLMVCSSAGERVKRFWPRHFFVMFYAVHLAVLGIVVSM